MVEQPLHRRGPVRADDIEDEEARRTDRTLEPQAAEKQDEQVGAEMGGAGMQQCGGERRQQDGHCARYVDEPRQPGGNEAA